MLNHRSRNLGPVIRILGLVILLTLALWLLFSMQPGSPPAVALKAARELAQSGQLAASEKYLAEAADDKRLAPWVSVIRGELAARNGNVQEARRLLSAVPSSSAAFPDAQLTLFQLQGGNQVERSEFDELRDEFQAARRKDLLASLLMIQARELERAGEPAAARDLYWEVRRQYGGSADAEKARAAQRELSARNPSMNAGDDVSAILEEARILVAENAFDDALAALQSGATRVEPHSDAYFQIRLLEEKVLRALKRHEDADHLLLIISADGGLGTADEAMLRIARNAWNISDNHRALMFLDKLKERFPTSEWLEEARYTEARILEELEQLPDAQEVYIDLSKNSRTPQYAIRALLRLSLLYLLSDSCQQALPFLKQAATALEQEANGEAVEQGPDPTAQSSRAEGDYDFTLFWQAYCISRLDDQSLRQAGYPGATPQPFLAKLRSRAGIGYYEMLSRRVFPGETTTAMPESGTCKMLDLAALSTNVPLLDSAGLTDLVQHEIDWQLLRSSRPEQDSAEALLYTELARAKLYQRYLSPFQGIEVAGALVRNNSDRLLLVRCREQLLDVLYPVTYVKELAIAASNAQLPVPLLLAVTRTESAFNPQARSRVGALGLMQLMPETAAHEGLQSGEDLFEPQRNVLLGAKHLARLFGEFHGNNVFAIAAYNAGGGAVNRWISRLPRAEWYLWIENVGFSETKNYLKRVLLAESIYRKKLDGEKSPV